MGYSLNPGVIILLLDFTGRKNMEPEVLAALVAGFAGSILGAIAGLAQFKQERSFDRQLDWYERAVRALFDMVQKIEIAITHHEEGRNTDLIASCWRDVQRSHREIDRMTAEGNIYASAFALSTMQSINDAIQAVAERTNAFDPESFVADERPGVIKDIDSLPEQLLEAAKPLAAEARNHLEIT